MFLPESRQLNDRMCVPPRLISVSALPCKSGIFHRHSELGAELSMGWVDPRVGLGWVNCSKSTKKTERIVLGRMHLKHGYIRFGCTKQLNLILRPIYY